MILQIRFGRPIQIFHLKMTFKKKKTPNSHLKIWKNKKLYIIPLKDQMLRVSWRTAASAFTIPTLLLNRTLIIVQYNDDGADRSVLRAMAKKQKGAVT